MTNADRLEGERNPTANRETFLLSLMRLLSGSLEQVIGVEDAMGFISLVGQKIGQEINQHYCSALQLSELSQSQVAEVLLDLKARIEGDFFLIEESTDKLVLGNHRCPFGAYVKGRESLCMMTSNVFGHITAQNLGYAKVDLEQTIARGDKQCRIVIYLQPDESLGSTSSREYFQG